MSTDWAAVLRERVATDPDFREEFRAHPGQAAASLGVPFEVFREVWPEFAEGDDPD